MVSYFEDYSKINFNKKLKLIWNPYSHSKCATKQRLIFTLYFLDHCHLIIEHRCERFINSNSLNVHKNYLPLYVE